MKKLLIILCFLPIFSFGSAPYKILSDTVFIGSIPYRTATGELLLFNNTKDTTESVLYNTGSGKTEFKKVRLIRLNDSTYVFKIGTTVIGDSIKIHSSGSGGGGGSGTVTDFIFTDGNGFDGTVTSSTTTPTLSLVGDTIYKFASVDRVLDSLIDINERIIEAQRLFPNGINFISEDYEIQASDEGKLIFGLSDTALNITMPSGIILPDYKTLGITLLTGGTFQLSYQDTAIHILGYISNTQSELRANKNAEIVLFSTFSNSGGGNSILMPISTTIINDVDTFKTALRYLYDKSVSSLGVTSVASGYGTTFSTITSTGTVVVDSTVIATKTYVNTVDATKQATLVSGTNIKTVNSTSLLGSGNIVTPDAQTLSRTFADSISLSISDGNTVKLPYAVDSVGATSDSIIVYKFGIRKSYTNGSSGGASLSGLTAATATNTINNTNYKQRWSWNTIGADTALVLNSTSTQANSNLQTVLAVTQSGANATSTQSTFGIKISNVKTGTSATNVGLDIVCSGGATNNAINIQSGYLKLNNNQLVLGASTSLLESGGGALAANVAAINILTSIGAGQLMSISSGGLAQFATGWVNSYSQPYLTLGGYREGSTQWRAYLQYPIIWQNINGDLSLSQDNSLTYGNVFTPTERVRFKVDGSVGVGTASPNASALMDLTSTTRGFLVSRGTTVNRDAIATPATLLQFGNTTLNTIDTYDGTRWTNSAKFLTNTATLDFGSTAAGAVSDLTITVTGATDGDAVMLGVPNASIVAAGSYSAWVSGANTVTVRYANNALVTSYDPASGTFKVTVNK